MQTRIRARGTQDRRLGRFASAPAVAWVLCLFVVASLSACQSGGPLGRSSQSSEDLLSRADRSFEAGGFGEAVEMYKLASVAARTEKDDARFIEAVAQVSSAYSMLGQPGEGESWLAQARTAAVEREQPAFGRVLLANALRARDEGREQVAETELLALFEWCMETERYAWALQASTLGSVVSPSSSRVAWCERGLQAAQASNERAWLSAAYQSLGFALEERGDYATAVIELRKARDLTPVGSRERVRADWALAHNLRLAGESDEAAQIIGRLIPVAKALHARGFSTRDAEWLGRCHEEWGELLVEANQWSAALRSFHSARQAYLLANIQDLAPRKWRRLEARIADVKMMRVRHSAQTAKDDQAKESAAQEE